MKVMEIVSRDPQFLFSRSDVALRRQPMILTLNARKAQKLASQLIH